MSDMNFLKKSISYEQIAKLAISGGYSCYYPITKPVIPIVGDWEKRYCVLADTFRPILDQVYKFEVHQDDVYIVTSTKCGTTWAQEMTWLIMNDFDFNKANSVDLTIRSPFLEFNGVVSNVPHNTIDAANALKRPRLLKSHLPAMMLPLQIWNKKAKIIYIFRSPEDAAVSYFHHWRGMVGYNGTKEEFMQSYMAGYVNFNPFWPHVLDFWQLRHTPQVFFTSYERMKRELHSVIKDVCNFLDRSISKQNLLRMTDHLSFENMKNNPFCNHVKEFESMKKASGREADQFRFVRRGIVGSHKDELPDSLIQEFDKWTLDNLEEFNLSQNDFINYSKF